MADSQLVTRNDIKLLFVIVPIVIAGTFAWADLKSIAQDAKKESVIAKEVSEVTAEKQNQIALDVREIKTILREKGISAKAPQASLLSIAAPQIASITPRYTPVPTSITQQKETIYQTTTTREVKEVQNPPSTPTPTQIAMTPTPTSSPALLCRLGICL